jgi:hypothetical protein
VDNPYTIDQLEDFDERKSLQVIEEDDEPIDEKPP